MLIVNWVPNEMAAQEIAATLINIFLCKVKDGVILINVSNLFFNPFHIPSTV